MKPKTTRRELLRMLRLQDRAKRECQRVEDLGWSIYDTGNQLVYSKLAAAYLDDVRRIGGQLEPLLRELQGLLAQAREKAREDDGEDA